MIMAPVAAVLALGCGLTLASRSLSRPAAGIYLGRTYLSTEQDARAVRGLQVAACGWLAIPCYSHRDIQGAFVGIIRGGAGTRRTPPCQQFRRRRVRLGPPPHAKCRRPTCRHCRPPRSLKKPVDALVLLWHVLCW
ncbi:hypothetical protein F4802DRAFT_486227 [Xylaria palmicola]|nr:hypothetical protein F4802DRAFT_486227 [Xylaria palmicola]